MLKLCANSLASVLLQSVSLSPLELMKQWRILELVRGSRFPLLSIRPITPFSLNAPTTNVWPEGSDVEVANLQSAAQTPARGFFDQWLHLSGMQVVCGQSASSKRLLVAAPLRAKYETVVLQLYGKSDRGHAEFSRSFRSQPGLY